MGVPSASLFCPRGCLSPMFGCCRSLPGVPRAPALVAFCCCWSRRALAALRAWSRAGRSTGRSRGFGCGSGAGRHVYRPADSPGGREAIGDRAPAGETQPRVGNVRRLARDRRRNPTLAGKRPPPGADRRPQPNSGWKTYATDHEPPTETQLRLETYATDHGPPTETQLRLETSATDHEPPTKTQLWLENVRHRPRTGGHNPTVVGKRTGQVGSRLGQDGG